MVDDFYEHMRGLPTLSQLAGIQRVMAAVDTENHVLTPDEQATVAENHRRFVETEFRSRLSRYDRDLIAPFVDAIAAEGSVSSELASRIRGMSTGTDVSRTPELPGLMQALEADCPYDVSFRPRFDFASPLQHTEDGGQATTLSRGSVDGTLEVAASVGRFPAPARSFPGQPSGSGAAYNMTHATVWKVVQIERRAGFSLVDVSATLGVEQVMGRSPVSWENYTFVLPGPPDSPPDGLATAWCDVLLSLHSAAGSASSFVTMASSSVMGGDDRPRTTDDLSVFPSLRVAVPEGTQSLMVGIDLRAVAWVARAQAGEGFAEIAIHNDPSIGLLTFGAATALGQVRVLSLATRDCPLPVLGLSRRTPSVDSRLGDD